VSDTTEPSTEAPRARPPLTGHLCPVRQQLDAFGHLLQGLVDATQREDGPQVEWFANELREKYRAAVMLS
jgi:hypothetical protein